MYELRTLIGRRKIKLYFLILHVTKRLLDGKIMRATVAEPNVRQQSTSR